MNSNPPPQSPSPDDQAAASRKEAFLAAERKFGAFVFRYFRHKARDYHLAEDLYQELWMHVYRSFPTEDFNNPDRLRHKAFQVFVAYTRRAGVRNFLEFRAETPEPTETDQSAMPQNPAEAERFYREFWERFPGLNATEQQKQAFFLRNLAGYTLQEISRQLNVPDSTIHDWLITMTTMCRRHFAP